MNEYLPNSPVEFPAIIKNPIVELSAEQSDFLLGVAMGSISYIVG